MERLHGNRLKALEVGVLFATVEIVPADVPAAGPRVLPSSAPGSRRVPSTTSAPIFPFHFPLPAYHFHFVHVFRRERSQTPGQYRAQHKLILGHCDRMPTTGISHHIPNMVDYAPVFGSSHLCQYAFQFSSAFSP